MNVVCDFSNSLSVTCNCSNSTNLDLAFPPLVFTIGAKNAPANLTLSGSSYMRYVGPAKCISLILRQTGIGEDQHWTLGLPFF